jgi:predicted acylesterase/phospholipase RssA
VILKTSTPILLFTLSVALLLQGCVIPTRLSAVPENAIAHAEVPGMPGIRFMAGDDTTQFKLGAQQILESELAFRAKTGQVGPLPPVDFLAISGGGDKGAYGAGLLCGWTVAGNRPEFKLVTGVSTGALIAPFAFLGPKYDAKLKALYTNSSQDHIMEERSLMSVVFDDAMADNRPLWRLLEKHITPEMLREIAQEYTKGRMLLVATTNLDSQRSVIWNLTKIAASGHPHALDLFRKVMIASTAIPGAFPPSMIEVQANGKHYQEMHVDGGATSQVFVYPAKFHLREHAAQMGIRRERKLYIILNAFLDPEWAEVERRSFTIASKAIESLIRTKSIGDLYRIYATAQRDGIDFNLTYIPSTFMIPHKEDFNTDYMRQLFKKGYDVAVTGHPWEKSPPGF